MDTPTYGVATTQQDMPLFDSSYSVDSGRGSQLNSKQNGAQGVGNAKFDIISPEEQQPYYQQAAQYGSWWPNLENNRLQIPTENPIFQSTTVAPTKETYFNSRLDGFNSFGPQFDAPSERAFPLRSSKYPDPVDIAEKENFEFKNHIARGEEWGTTIFGSILAIVILWVVSVFALGGISALMLGGQSSSQNYYFTDQFSELL